MSDLRELYQEVILDHGRNPRNHRLPEGDGCAAHGNNPLCGDKMVLKVVLDGDVIADIGFRGEGCAISQASASTMTEAVKGMSRTDVEALFAEFHRLVTGDAMNVDYDRLGKLAVFAGVAEFPVRVKCASLAWHTLRAALAGTTDHVTTE
jgi:nitrogen fixation NifU-like protein